MPDPIAAPAAPAAAPTSTPAPTTGATPAPGGAAPANAAGKTATPPGGQQGAPVQPTVNRFKRKETINGKEVELEATEDELWSGYRKVKAADLRFEEAARLRKDAELKLQQQQQMVQQLQTNPRALLNYLREQGVKDPLDFVANVLQEQLAEEERLSDPNVRRAHELEQQVKTFEQKEREQQLQQQTQEFDARVEQELDSISATFDAALKMVDLPADDDTLAIMAQLEQVNRRQGLKITPEKLAEATQERVARRGIKALTAMTYEQLEKTDPAFVKHVTKVITNEWKRRKAAAAQQPPAPPAAPSIPAPTQPKILSDKEEWEKIRPGRRVLRTI